MRNVVECRRRNPPGTLKASLAEEMGLVHKEVTLVMSDVQASSKLWEWSAYLPLHFAFHPLSQGFALCLVAL